MDYSPTAGFYANLEAIYFNNVTSRSRKRFLGNLPREPVNALIVGCGSGTFVEDFISYHQPSLLVLNDTSLKMLEITAARVKRLGFLGELRIENVDIMELHSEEKFDLISMNYFLSIFPPTTQLRIENKIRHLMGDEGILQFADYTLPKNPAMLPFFYLNWYVCCLLFWLLAGNKPNKLGDPEKLLEQAGWRISHCARYIGGLFGSFLLVKSSSPEDFKAGPLA